MRIHLSKKAEKFLLKTDRLTERRVRLALEGLKTKPPKGDIKHYKALSDCLRLRVGSFRVIFYIEDDVIWVVDIDSRGQIYD